MNNINEIFSTKLFNKEGIWYSKKKSITHYPAKGNELCLDLEDKSFWFKHRNDCIIALINYFSKKNETFLDIGGGNGFVSCELQKHGFKPTLIDPGISGVKNAKNRGIKQIICSNFEDINFNKDSIDAVGLFDVIEHVENDLSFLKKIHYILNKNGKIYITVPAYQFLFSKEDYFAGHQRRYSLRSLKQILKKAKFDVIYSTYYFSIFIIPILISRKLIYLFKKKKFDVFSEIKKEHKDPAFLLNKLFKITFKWELKKVKKLNKIPFGTSCLIIAKKQ